MNAKYVIWESPSGEERAVILSGHQSYSAVLPWLMPSPIILSAGEFQLIIYIETDDIGVQCFGGSTTLGVKSRGQDDAWALEQLLRIGAFQGK